MRRLGSDYVQGVPTPYAMHVHPYPTRFHGGIWSRPTFEFPEAAIPSTVFLPPRDIDMIPDRPASGYTGMGEVQYDVGEGIFRPGGYGGGVFDGNLAGAPALGHASARTLGDVASDATNYPMGKYSAQTLQLQNALNAKLIQNGFCPVIADGKLGPASCGAAMYAGGLNPGATILWPSTCTDFKQIAKASTGCGTGPSAPAVSPAVAKANAAAVVAALPMVSSSTKKVLGFLAGGLAAVGVVYYVKKRRG